MCQFAIEWIRKMIPTGEYTFSSHALHRMSEREFTQDQVLNCIRNGEIFKIQDIPDKDRHILFRQKNPIDFYVVVATSLPFTIVTVCNTQKECQESVRDCIRREKSL